jgi:hypothetical protein
MVEYPLANGQLTLNL